MTKLVALQVTPKGRSQQTPDPAGANLLHGVSLHSAVHILCLWPIITAIQHEDQPQMQTCKQPSSELT